MKEEKSSNEQIAEFLTSTVFKQVWSSIVGNAPRDAMEKYCNSEVVTLLVSALLGNSLANVDTGSKAGEILSESLFKTVVSKDVGELSKCIKNSIKAYTKLLKDGLDKESATKQSLVVLVTEISRSAVRNFVYVSAPKLGSFVPDLFYRAARDAGVKMMSDPAVAVLREVYGIINSEKKDFRLADLLAASQEGFVKGVESSFFGLLKFPRNESSEVMLPGSPTKGSIALDNQVVLTILDKEKEVPLKGKNLSTDPTPTPATTSKLHQDGLRRRGR
jgi:hypothetical protein